MGTPSPRLSGRSGWVEWSEREGSRRWALSSISGGRAGAGVDSRWRKTGGRVSREVIWHPSIGPIHSNCFMLCHVQSLSCGRQERPKIIRAQWCCSRSCSSVRGPRASSTGIPWVLVTNAESQPYPTPAGSEPASHGACRWSMAHVGEAMVWSHLWLWASEALGAAPNMSTSLPAGLSFLVVSPARRWEWCWHSLLYPSASAFLSKCHFQHRFPVHQIKLSLGWCRLGRCLWELILRLCGISRLSFFSVLREDVLSS